MRSSSAEGLPVIAITMNEQRGNLDDESPGADYLYALDLQAAATRNPGDTAGALGLKIVAIATPVGSSWTRE